MMVATALSIAASGASHCRPVAAVTVNFESGCHVGEFNRTVFNHHTVDTNYRGDIITISHRGGVGHDSFDSYRVTTHRLREPYSTSLWSLVEIVHVIVVPPSESTSLPVPL